MGRAGDGQPRLRGRAHPSRAGPARPRRRAARVAAPAGARPPGRRRPTPTCATRCWHSSTTSTSPTSSGTTTATSPTSPTPVVRPCTGRRWRPTASSTSCARRHPALEIESCSSGGGRVDAEVLTRTDRIWPSDTNDPLERQHLQRWTSLLVPPELMGSHVAAPTSHTTGRTHSLRYRAATALLHSFGIEWDMTRARRGRPGRAAILDRPAQAGPSAHRHRHARAPRPPGPGGAGHRHRRGGPLGGVVRHRPPSPRPRPSTPLPCA